MVKLIRTWPHHCSHTHGSARTSTSLSVTLQHHESVCVTRLKVLDTYTCWPDGGTGWPNTWIVLHPNLWWDNCSAHRVDKEHCTSSKHWSGSHTHWTLAHSCSHTTTSDYMAQSCPASSDGLPGFKERVRPNCFEPKHHNLPVTNQKKKACWWKHQKYQHTA